MPFIEMITLAHTAEHDVWRPPSLLYGRVALAVADKTMVEKTLSNTQQQLNARVRFLWHVYSSQAPLIQQGF